MVIKQNYIGCCPSSNKGWKKAFSKDAKKYSKNNYMIPIKDSHFDRIMTYNVHYWTNITSKEVTYEQIIEKINFISPDLVGLQEILIPEVGSSTVYSSLGWSIKDVYSKLDGYNIEKIGVSDTMCSGSTMFGNMLGSKYPVKRVERIVFNSSMTKSEKRGAIMCITNSVLFIVTHLDVWDSSGKTRREQLKQLFSFVDNKYDKNIPMVMVGDFNCLQREDYDDNVGINGDFSTIETIKEYGFEDVFSGLNYSVWSARRVDYIFVKNFYREIIGKYVYYDDLSDHFSLIVDIKN